MNVKTNIANRNNYGSKRNVSNIRYIVIHYTGNDGDSDEGNGKYFNGNRGVSAHYFVDDDSITQSVNDDYIAWSVGGNKYPNCGETGGGKWYGKCTNANSISIELCDSIKNGKFDFTENTLRQAAELTKELMAKYNVPLENVIRHFDVTGKICPLPFVRQPEQWKEFKQRLSMEQEDKQLYEACRKLLLDGINININQWKRIDLIKLNNVDSLLRKLGGIDTIADAIVRHGMTFNKALWTYAIDHKSYSKENVRSLIIKYAATL